MASRRQRWELVAAERIALADRAVTLDPGQWDAPSRCEGWRVRDVLAHLVHMAESTWRSMSGDLRAQAGRDRYRGFLLCARELGKQPVPELADRLRRPLALQRNAEGRPVGDCCPPGRHAPSPRPQPPTRPRDRRRRPRCTP